MHLDGQIVGVDESGKGDFFGPLVVAGLLAGQDDLARLKELGVRDSKRLSDNRCLEIDRRLRDAFIHEVIVLSPAEYNRTWERIRNLNILLADCHAGVIAAVANKSSTQVDLAVSDKFDKDERLETALSKANCALPVKQLVRGEAVPQVAAASILARAEFIRQLQALSGRLGVKLPKGASAQVDAAGRRLVSLKGIDILSQVAKIHFKNFKRVSAGDLFAK